MNTGCCPVMLSPRPKFWPRPLSRRQRFGLGLEALASASASNIWPRFGLDLVVLLCNRAFSGKNRVKFGNFVNFSVNNLKSYKIIIWYFFHNYFWPLPWPQPPEIGLGLGLFLSLVALASASASRFWPRLTSLLACVCPVRRISGHRQLVDER